MLEVTNIKPAFISKIESSQYGHVSRWQFRGQAGMNVVEFVQGLRS